MSIKWRFFIRNIMIILVAIVLSLATTNSIVSAVSVDLFAKTDVKNNSNTTQTAPYLNVDKQPVTFTIDGSTTGVGLIKTGTKYAYISIPAELSGKVTLPLNPQTTVTAKVTILKADLPIGGLLTSLNSVLGSVTGILLTNLSNAINALQNEDFGTQTMTITTQQPLPTLLVADISQGLLPILTKALITRLENVKNELNKIILLGDTISNLLTSINTLISALNDTTSTTSKNLVAASILGTTNVTMPTLVSSPTGLAQDYTANIRGGITQSDAITVDILSSFGNNTAIYFSAGSVVLNGSQLPANLNFGTHAIQTVADENWLAYVNGNSANGLQTGKIRIDDTRTAVKSWQLKVSQPNNWLNNQSGLTNAQLSISLGTLSTNLTGTLPSAVQSVTLTSGNQSTLVTLGSTTSTGYVEVPLNQFKLFVPKNTAKQTGNYQTTLQWTLSNTP